MTAPVYSPGPWAYQYSPYTVQEASPLGVGADIPAYEVFDAAGNKVFDTNEDTPAELQEANARMGAAAPRLLASLVTSATLLADYDESDGEEGETYREALAAIAEATGTSSMPRKLPPDPDNMNDSRAEWAGAALSAFIKETGTHHEDALADLLADLMHWADRNSYEFDAALERARMHYEPETAGKRPT